jgi:hypothetical protein
VIVDRLKVGVIDELKVGDYVKMRDSLRGK